MRKLRILTVSLCMMLGLTLTSCVGAEAAVNESGISVDILVSDGIPYYDLNSTLLYYYWNGRYWYRYWYRDTWYYRPYVRPLPGYRRPHFTGPQTGDVWRRGPGRPEPGRSVRRPDIRRPNTAGPRTPDRISPQVRPDKRSPTGAARGNMNRNGNSGRFGGSRITPRR